MVGRKQHGASECPEEDRSRGVPGRAEAHADEKGQAKQGGNIGKLKARKFLAGPGLSW